MIFLHFPSCNQQTIEIQIKHIPPSVLWPLFQRQQQLAKSYNYFILTDRGRDRERKRGGVEREEWQRRQGRREIIREDRQIEAGKGGEEEQLPCCFTTHRHPEAMGSLRSCGISPLELGTDSLRFGKRQWGPRVSRRAVGTSTPRRLPLCCPTGSGAEGHRWLWLMSCVVRSVTAPFCWFNYCGSGVKAYRTIFW